MIGRLVARVAEAAFVAMFAVLSDLGTSQQTGRPVLTDLLDYVPATLEIAVPTLVLSLLIGASLGLVGAVKHNRWQDQGIRVVSLLGLSTPPFWISILALLGVGALFGVSAWRTRRQPAGR